MTAPNTAPTSAVLSNVITNWDASPIVRPGAGAGGFSVLQRAQATITPGISQAVGVMNRMVRIPSNAVVSRVAIGLDAAATFVGDVGLWYSDANDGTSVVNRGNLTAISSAFFAYELTMTTFTYLIGTDPANVIGLSAPVDITFSASTLALTDGNYVMSQSANPIWLAVANLLALQTTPVGAFTSASQAPHFQTVSAGASVYVRSDDPGGFFDICMNVTSTGSATPKPVTMFVDFMSPGP